jgi:hypothetical protein
MLDKKFFNEQMQLLEEYFQCECVLMEKYFDDYDHLENKRFQEICDWLQKKYKIFGKPRFPLRSDFEDAKNTTAKHEEHEEYKTKTDDDLFHDPEAQKILSDIVRGLNEKSRKFVEEKKITDPVFLRKYEVKEQQRKRKELHDMGMVFSYEEGKYVNKSSMEAIGGQFKDTFTGEEFSFFKTETDR